MRCIAALYTIPSTLASSLAPLSCLGILFFHPLEISPVPDSFFRHDSRLLFQLVLPGIAFGLNRSDLWQSNLYYNHATIYFKISSVLDTLLLTLHLPFLASIPFLISSLFHVFAHSYLACGQHNGIKPQDPIRCRSCGYRILYKVRTKRSK